MGVRCHRWDGEGGERGQAIESKPNATTLGGLTGAGKAGTTLRTSGLPVSLSSIATPWGCGWARPAAAVMVVITARSGGSVTGVDSRICREASVAPSSRCRCDRVRGTPPLAPLLLGPTPTPASGVDPSQPASALARRARLFTSAAIPAAPTATTTHRATSAITCTCVVPVAASLPPCEPFPSLSPLPARGATTGARLGMKVGPNVGRMVGADPVGMDVGGVLGSDVAGCTVGRGVGATVGAAVGAAVVGIIEGSSVGDAVGLVDGFGVGLRVGSKLGCLVGAIVGATVGRAVGEADGRWVSWLRCPKHEVVLTRKVVSAVWTGRPEAPNW